MSRQHNLFPKSGLPHALSRAFDAFWNAYPPRQSNPRAVAETAFRAAVRDGADPDDLATAADAYHAEVRKRGIGQEFVLHASTFLRQRRYQDYLRTPVAEAPAPAAEIDHPLWTYLRGTWSPSEFRVWIAPLEVRALSEGHAATLVAPSRFHRDWLRQHHAVPLKAALRVQRLDIEIAEDLLP